MAMNYLQELANALGPKVEEAAKGSTFLNFANTMSSPIPYQQGSNPNPWQVALIESLKGFVGGASEAYGKHQIKDDMRQFSQQWATAAGSANPIQAFKDNPELAEYAPQIELRDQMLRQEAAKAEKERRQKLIDQTMINPGTETRGPNKIEFRFAEGPNGQLQKVYGDEYPRWKPGSGSQNITINGTRRETAMGDQAADFRKAIQGDKQLGDMYEASEAMDTLDRLMATDNNVAEAIAKAKVARGLASEVGVMTDKDIERYIPSDLTAELKAVKNYFSGTADSTWNPNTKKAVQAVLRAGQADLRQKVEQRRKQYYHAAQYELPFFKPEEQAALVDNYFTTFKPSGSARAAAPVVETPTQQAGPMGQRGEEIPAARIVESGGRRFQETVGPDGQPALLEIK